MEWLRDNWLRLHLAISPLGTLVVTWLLLYFVGTGQWWNSKETLDLAGQTTPFGGILYGSSVFVLEVTVRMLWALAQRQKDIDKARGEGREEGREEGRKEGREEGRQLLIKKMLERGIDIPPEFLQGLEDSEQR